MSEEASLFGDDEEPSQSATPPVVSASLPDWRIDQLRKALDGTGISDMAARQALVQRIVGRPVQSLRELTSPEAVKLATGLRPDPTGQVRPTAWEERDEDTWIDRL